MDTSLWKKCLTRLKEDSSLSDEEFSTWVLPLQADARNDQLVINAPNSIVQDWVVEHIAQRIEYIAKDLHPTLASVNFCIGSTAPSDSDSEPNITSPSHLPETSRPKANNLNNAFTFDSFVVGKANQMAHAAAIQIARNPGKAYNPLFLYGGVGLGKTHLMHAIGNLIQENNPRASVLYLHSERFVGDMVKALQHNKMNQFKKHYRSLDALLIDDIQFFARKERSQEEFFHTFNALLDHNQQIILTCDKYPKEIHGVEERLRSRFGWGLTVAMDPPELETRVAILMSKAEQANVSLPHEVAFFIANRIYSNVRELEGALKRIIANAQFTGSDITLAFTQHVLKDLLAVQAKLVSIENIQKTVAQYYKLGVNDLLSKTRTRFIARARQMCMALSKELTSHSLPEIGEAFGGRDHTTVIHACRTIKKLVEDNIDVKIKEDYVNLLRILST